MIVDELKCIYFHVGKTAGVSVEKWLLDETRDWRKADRRRMFGWDADEGVFLQHATADTVLRLAGTERFNDYYKFAVVRNPYERLISVFYYLYPQHMKKHGSFQNFVLNLPDIVAKPDGLKGSHYLPQTRYTHIDGEQVVDDIVKFEALPHSLTIVANRLGINRPLGHENRIHQEKRPTGSASECYSGAMIQSMREVYRSDFDSLGYPDCPDT